MIFYFILSIVYFLDVLIGLFLIDHEYSVKGLDNFRNHEQNYKLKSRQFDAVEVGLLCIIILEIIVKLTYTSRNHKKVLIQCMFLFILIDRYPELGSEKLHLMLYARYLLLLSS